MSVSDLLQFLAVGRKTGLLKFSHGKVVKGIYFENGIIIGSSTNDPKEYFGQVLIHYGKIDEAQLQAAMEAQRHFQGATSPGQSSTGVAQEPHSAVQSPTSRVQSPATSEVQASKAVRNTPGDSEAGLTEDPASQLVKIATSATGAEAESQIQSEASPLQLSAGEVQASADKPKTKLSHDARGKSGGRLGQVLVAQGVLTEDEVRAVLEIRTLDIIYDLFFWKEGQFEFLGDDPLPRDFTRVHVEATRVIMDGIYRADELARYRTLIPSDRSILELGTGWTSSLDTSKATRQLFYFLEKRMSVAEICYNVHSSSFEVYGQLYELVKNGLAHVVGELPEVPDPVSEIADLPEDSSDALLLARSALNNEDAERALSIIHTVLRQEPKNAGAQNLLLEAEKTFVNQVYSQISPTGVPKIVISTEELANKEIGPQEGFVLSRINGVWDIQSILSICPFREADSLLMIKTLWDGGVIGF